ADDVDARLLEHAGQAFAQKDGVVDDDGPDADRAAGWPGRAPAGGGGRTGAGRAPAAPPRAPPTRTGG
ncbi:hypothetical protein, partial [Curtobacterium sp. PsM8]|uniref:hypothetical protein n=1 Tax=Curtobacterium sp. PsM8 TaxID=3030532 RepID=UPI00263A5FD9